MTTLARFLDWLLGPPKSDVLEQTHRVTPDPALAEALELKRAELAFRPENGFITDQLQQRRHR